MKIAFDVDVLAKQMLNKEYQEGVRHVILTPHFRYDMFEPHMNIVTRQFMQLRRAAMNIGDEEGIQCI